MFEERDPKEEEADLVAFFRALSKDARRAYEELADRDRKLGERGGLSE